MSGFFLNGRLLGSHDPGSLLGGAGVGSRRVGRLGPVTSEGGSSFVGDSGPGVFCKVRDVLSSLLEHGILRFLTHSASPDLQTPPHSSPRRGPLVLSSRGSTEVSRAYYATHRNVGIPSVPTEDCREGGEKGLRQSRGPGEWYRSPLKGSSPRPPTRPLDPAWGPTGVRGP